MTLVCWVTFGRVHVFDGSCLGPSAETSGRAASTKLTTGPMTGSGSSPVVSVEVWWAAVRWYGLQPPQRVFVADPGVPVVEHVLAGGAVLDVVVDRRGFHRLRDLGDPVGGLAGDPAGVLQRLHLVGQRLLPVAAAGDELELLLGQVAAGLLGVLDDAVDELLFLFDLRRHAGEHLVCGPHCRGFLS